MNSDSGGSILICAARLFDGSSSAVHQDHAVLVQGEYIKAVGPRASMLEGQGNGAVLIDLGDVCLMPGLIDTHTHVSLPSDGRSYVECFAESDEMMVLTGVRNLRRALEAGITTVRDLGARNMVAFTLKEGLRRGYITGSRLLVCGRSITCTEGHFHMCNEVADGEVEMRRSVRRLVHQGADFIKIMASGGGTVGTIPSRASYSVDELRAAVQEAVHLDRLTAAHCRATESMQRAVDAGVHLIEHAEFLSADGQLLFDPGLAAQMAACGTWISPTLAAWTGYTRLDTLYAQSRAGSLTPAEERALAAMDARAETRLELVRDLVDAGLKERILPGSDAGVGHLQFGKLMYDLQLLARTGFTAAEALRAATRQSAAAMGRDDLGTIEPGKVADLAAFAGDPTDDLEALRHVAAVFQAGKQVV